jgi:O-antigen/teichoic acid export membrane protein
MLRSFVLRTLLTNSGIIALGLTNSILLSRWLGPAGRGEIAAAMLWPTLLVYLSSMGLIASTLYFSALPNSKPRTVISNAIAMAAIQSPFALVLGFVAMPYLLESQSATVVNASRLFLLVIPISLCTQYGISLLQGRLHIKAFNWLRTILPVGYLLGTLGLMATGKLTLLNIVILHLGLNLTALAATLGALIAYNIGPTFQTDKAVAGDMFKYGAKVHVGSVSGLANQSLDQVLMAAWLPPTYLGLYVVAVSAAGLSQIFSQAVQMISTPSITQRKTLLEKTAVLQAVFRKYWVFSLMFTAAVAAIVPFAIPLVFGNAFKPAVWPTEILLLGAFFLGAKELLAGGAQALGNPWLGSKAHLFALFVTVGVLYLLLPTLGIMGAAIASAAAYATQLLVVVVGLHRSHGIRATELFRIRLNDLSAAFDEFKHLRRTAVPVTD